MKKRLQFAAREQMRGILERRARLLSLPSRFRRRHAPSPKCLGSMKMLIVNERLRIPLREIHFQFARSSGPGGQNVNKVSSKAVLRWNMAASPSAPDDVKRKPARAPPAPRDARGRGRHHEQPLSRSGPKRRRLLRKTARRPRRSLYASQTQTPHAPHPRIGKEKRLQDKRERAEKKRKRGRVEG